MPSKDELRSLIDRVEKARRPDNALDMEIEIALETARGRQVRANSAGTKLIYTDPEGAQQTCWAWDWTLDAEHRRNTANALRSLEAQETDNA